MDDCFRAVLNSQQLIEARKRASKTDGNFSKFRVGNKCKKPPSDAAELEKFAQTLDAVLSNKCDAIKRERLKLKKDIGEAVYSSVNDSIVVTKAKNKPSFMGYVKDAVTHLYPEEALFLMECEAIEVIRDGLRLSIQEAYQLFLKNAMQFDKYKIYSYLSRIGFQIRRHFSERCELFKENVKTERNDQPDGEIVKKQNEPIVDEPNAKKPKLNENELFRKCDRNLKILSKSMFLEPDFEDQLVINMGSKDCKSWSEYKKMLKQTQKLEYSANAYVFEDPENLKKLSSVLKSNNFKPVISNGEILSDIELYKRLQLAGPQTLDDFSIAPDFVDNLIAFDCFLPTNKTTSDIPDFHIAVVDANTDPPSVTNLLALTKESGPVKLIFAIVKESEFNFYKIKPFECWQEIPHQWKAIKNLFSSSS